MSYIGSSPATSPAVPTSQSFNGDGSTTVFTLNKSVDVSEELEVFVNNVQQEPGSGKAYTASGTTLTFSSAPSSGTGNVYVIYRGYAERTVRIELDNTSSFTAGTANITSSLNTATIKDSSGTNTALTIDSSGRILTPARPAFSVIHIETTASAQAQTGHIQFNTVDTNVGSHWSTSNNRFEVPVNGVYHFAFSGIGCNSVASPVAAAGSAHVVIQKSTDSGSNWSEIAMGYGYAATSAHYPNVSSSNIVTLNSGDYVRVFAIISYIYAHTAANQYNPTFSGFLVG